jgi:hypothetical protein
LPNGGDKALPRLSSMAEDGLRQQMDVCFCGEHEQPVERQSCARRDLTSDITRSRERAAPDTSPHP